MTNKERMLKQFETQSREPAPRSPWNHPRELRAFWAMANGLYGKGKAMQAIYDTLSFQYHVEKLHQLGRAEFLKLMGNLAEARARIGVSACRRIGEEALAPSHRHAVTPSQRPSEPSPTLDSYFAETAMSPSWRKIRWLQKQLDWTDAHLVNYIMSVTHIDHIRWLSVNRAHAVISGMEKSRRLREKARVGGEETSDKRRQPCG